MSVPQPLASDDSRAKAERDLQNPGRRNEVPAREGDVADPVSSVSGSRFPEQVIVAPMRLGLASRVEFREAASKLIDSAAAGTDRLVVDCSRLRSIDSSGLNALILVQRRAVRRYLQVALRDLDEELRLLLVLTKLDDLFELQDGQSH